MNAWESIFTLSPVNDGYYDDDKLPAAKLAVTKKDLVSGETGSCSRAPIDGEFQAHQ